MNKNWTRPYCNTTHMKGLPKGLQITLQFMGKNRGEVVFLNFHQEAPFTNCLKFYGTLKECIKQAHKWAEAYQFFKGEK